MKKLLIIAAFMFGATGISHAEDIDGQTSGVDKHRISGFGLNDSFVAQGQPSSTTVTLNDVGTLVTENASLNTDGLASGFIHDFLFSAVQDTFVAVSSALQLSSGNNSDTIQPLILQVWHILAGPGNDVLLGSGSLDALGSSNPSTAFQVALVAGENYVVRMSNQGGTIGATADYTINVVTPVPVPAAVWLFGTAMVGLFGLRRKSLAKAAVA